MINVVSATHKHALQLSTRLRADDIREIQASGGKSPLAALSNSVRRSLTCRTVLEDGKPICIFGIVRVSPGVGCVWAMGSDRIAKNPRALIAISRQYKDHWFKLFPLLWNRVDARNTLHINYLKQMGFTFLDTPVLVGKHRRPFLEFYSCANPSV